MSENTITPATQSRFEQANYSAALTDYSVGYKDSENISALLDFIAPPIPVGRRFEFKRANNAEAFYSESDDVRSIGSEFKRVQYSGESINEKTLNKGLSIRVDNDEVVGDKWQERYTAMLIQRLLRNELRRAIAALDAISTSSDKVWDSSANPDEDLRNALMLSANESGVRPNRMLFGESAWDMRASCLEKQSTSGAFKSGSMTPNELAQKLMLDGCKIAGARYQTASGKTQIGSLNVYAFFAQNGISKDEASNLKRFYTPTEDGTMFRVYCQEYAKYTDITVEHYSSIVACSNLGVRKLCVSAQ